MPYRGLCQDCMDFDEAGDRSDTVKDLCETCGCCINHCPCIKEGEE